VGGGEEHVCACVRQHEEAGTTTSASAAAAAAVKHPQARTPQGPIPTPAPTQEHRDRTHLEGAQQVPREPDQQHDAHGQHVACRIERDLGWRFERLAFGVSYRSVRPRLQQKGQRQTNVSAQKQRKQLPHQGGSPHLVVSPTGPRSLVGRGHARVLCVVLLLLVKPSPSPCPRRARRRRRRAVGPGIHPLCNWARRREGRVPAARGI